MAIVILRQDNKMDLWHHAISKRAGAIPVYRGDQSHPHNEITMALVWKHPAGSLGKYPNLKAVHSMGAGVDFVFEDPAFNKEIPLLRVVDDKLASDMAEFVLSRILSWMKNLETFKLDQAKGQWRPMDYKSIAEVTVGIMGLGKLGQATARLLSKIGFEVIGWSRSPKSFSKIKNYQGEEEKKDFLSRSEVLVCLLPLTPSTQGILNSDTFQVLPKGALVINVARGGHLVDNDLLEALKTGNVAAAALDVYHEEPLPEEHPFWKEARVHMSPHVASVSDPATVITQFLENFTALMAGKPLKNQVSLIKGY